MGLLKGALDGRSSRCPPHGVIADDGVLCVWRNGTQSGAGWCLDKSLNDFEDLHERAAVPTEAWSLPELPAARGSSGADNTAHLVLNERRRLLERFLQGLMCPPFAPPTRNPP